jgi:hypothetical protein
LRQLLRLHKVAAGRWSNKVVSMCNQLLRYNQRILEFRMESKAKLLGHPIHPMLIVFRSDCCCTRIRVGRHLFASFELYTAYRILPIVVARQLA